MRSSPNPVGEKYGLSLADVIHIVENEQVLFMKSVKLAVVSLKVLFNASSPIRGRCFVLYESKFSVRLFAASFSALKMTNCLSFSIDRG